MSELKYRLKELLPSLSKQAQSFRDREAKSRYYDLKAIATSKKSVRRACAHRGVGRDYFYRWAKKLLRSRRVESLATTSKRPKRSPKQTESKVEKKILVLRSKMPFMGPERICNRLEMLHAIHCPPSTIYAVLKRNNLISKEYRKRRTKKHLKRYRRPYPGYLQMDFKYVPFKLNGLQYYQLSAVDHCSSWRLLRIYDHKGISELEDFLGHLEADCPFPIVQIQTDNDKAFTDKYASPVPVSPSGRHYLDQWCAIKNIEHKLIPIGEKELNGKVENTHKWDDDEFYSQHLIVNAVQLKALAIAYQNNWNRYRATKALGWKTPDQVIYEKQIGLLVTYLAIQGLRLDQQRRFDLIQSQIRKKNIARMLDRKRKLAQARKSENRYLAWMDWEATQYPKYSFLFVSSITPSYSVPISLPISLLVGVGPKRPGSEAVVLGRALGAFPRWCRAEDMP